MLNFDFQLWSEMQFHRTIWRVGVCVLCVLRSAGIRASTSSVPWGTTRNLNFATRSRGEFK